MNPSELKVLMISTDKNVAILGSEVGNRMKEYGKLVGELHIILSTTKSHNIQEVQIADNVFVYPTNSLSRWFYPFDASSLGKKIVYEKKFVRGKSLITCQDPFENGFAGVQIKKKWRIPLEVQLHTDPFSGNFYGFLNSIRKFMSKKVFSSCDSIRVVNSELAEKIVSFYKIDPKKIYILPIFVNQEKIISGKLSFDLHSKFDWSFIILSVGRLTPEKNLTLAIASIKKVNEKYPHTGLVIVGEGPLKSSLINFSKKTGIPQNISFEGFQKDLYSYYHSADAFLQTSKFEGYGLSLIEAGLSSLPVVTTNVGITKELKNGGDALIVEENADKISQAIIRLIEERELRKNLSENLKKTLQNMLISKNDYLDIQKEAWYTTSSKIQ